MSFGFGVNKKTTTTKTTKGSFGFGIKESTPKPVNQTKTVTLSDQVGGGSYKTSGPGSLILTKRGTDGLETTYSTDKNEIDHKVPVALGGISKKNNLQYLNSPLGKEDKTSRQQGKTAVEEQAIQDYKDGKISLPQARLLVMTKNQDINGLIPKQGVKANLLPAIKETITDPIKQGAKETFGFIKDATKASIKNKKNFGKDFIQGVKEAPKQIKDAGKDIAQTTARSVASVVVDPVQTLRGKDQVYTPKSKVTKAVFGKEPVKGIFKEQSDTQNALGKTGEKLGLGKGTSALLAGVTAPLLVGGLKAMDLTPFGTAEKSAGKAIVKDTVEQVSKDVLKKTTDNVAKGIVKPIEKTFVDSLSNVVKRNVDRKALSHLGEEGKTIFNKIETAGKEAVFKKSKQSVINLENNLAKLSDENIKNFANYAEGKVLVPKEAEEAVKLWKEVAQDISKTAQDAGLNIKTLDDTGKTINIPFKPRDNYYPQVINDKALKVQLSEKNYNNFLDKFAKENDISVEKARDWLDKDLFNKQFSNLERPRLGKLPDEVLEKDPRKILRGYIDSAYDRLSVAKEFGGNDEVLSKLYEQARKNGSDVEEMKLLTNRLLGREKFDESISKISSGVRAYNNITKLSLSAITNLGDVIKSPVRTNISSTIKAIAQSFTKKGKNFARRAGVSDNILDKFARDAGVGDKMYKITGFKSTEKKLRQITANASKNYIELLSRKLKANPNNAFARRRLEQFNLNPDKILEKGLTEDDLVKGSIKGISDLQPTLATDIPHTWQSPTGRVLTQYKTFAYKQGTFVKDYVIKEAAKGNVKPLITFLILGQAVGEGVADIKALVRGREREKDPVKRIIDNYMTIGGIGMVSDLTRAVMDDIQGNALMKFFAGPTFGDINDTVFSVKGDLEALKANKKFVIGRPSEKGERQPKTAKLTMSKIPFVGPYSSNKLFPTKEAYKARTPSSTLDEDIIKQIRGN